MLGGLRAGARHGLLGDVVADEAAVWERAGQEVERAPFAAAHVQDVYALFETLGQTGHQGQDVLLEGRDDRLAAVLGHDLVEAGEGRVGQPAAVLEALDDPILDRADHRHELGGDREVVGRGRPRQPRRVLRGKVVRLVLGVVIDDLADGHRAEPLAHVTLVEVGRRRNLLAGGRVQLGHGVEQAGPVAYAGLDHHRRAVEVAQEPPKERLGPCLVESLSRSHVLPFI